MKLVAVMLARNEAHEIGLTARAALMWADAIVVLNHASTDGTGEILCDIVSENEPGRVNVITETDPVWYEARHRQRMLMTAREIGATHIAINDADEILTGNLIGKIRPAIEALKPGQMLDPHWTCLARSLWHYYATGVWGDNWISFAFPDDRGYFWTNPAGYDFHHRHPYGRTLHRLRPFPKGSGGLMHLQFLNERRLRAKQFHYCLTERLRWPERMRPEQLSRMYGRAVYESDPTTQPLALVDQRWWEPYGHLMKYLDTNAVPWQEAENERIIREHPGIENGLDDWRLKPVV